MPKSDKSQNYKTYPVFLETTGCKTESPDNAQVDVDMIQ
jgi:hypothetical protein